MSGQNKITTEDNINNHNSSSEAAEIYAFPASYGQQQLWFLHQLAPQSSVYNIPFAFRFKGALNIPALEKSINEIIKRHETFRTVFTLKDGSLTQLIYSSLNLSFEIFNFSEIDEKERLAYNTVHDFTLKPFNLEKGPLIRAGLIILNNSEHILLLSFHHTILDHTSVLSFFSELTKCYDSFSREKVLDIPQPSIQYADMVIWQKDDNQVSVLRSKLDYWKGRLKDQDSFLNLPADKPRPAGQTFNGIEIKLSLSKALSNQLKELSRREKKSLFMVLLAAYKVFLYRYSGKTDITVGSPFANRTQPGMDEVMGCCMNTLPLRTIFSPEDSFIEVLNKVRDVTLGAQANQEVSFEQIVEELQPVRDASFNPLFQVSFMFQEPLTVFPLNGLTCEAVDINSHTSRFDLTYWMWDSQDGIQCLIQYNSDLYEDETIRRMFNNFSVLLESIVTQPGEAVSSYDILSKDERTTLISLWNKTEAEYPERKCIHQLFEAAAEKYPRYTAVESGNEKITYKELNKKSNQLARYLKENGMGRKALVGIFLDRSIDTVIAMLGTLKAGGTYIPLDPSFPKERLKYMLDDSKADILLTQSKYSGWFAGFMGDEILMDLNNKNLQKQKSSNPDFEISPGSLAYIIYTSGSTGRPKGVQIEHRSVVNFLTSMQREPGITEKDILLSVTTLSFDIAALEIFLPLISGAKLVLVTREITLDGKALLNKIESGKVTVMQATPATYRMMLAAGWDKKLPVKILCGGEALPADLAKELLKYGSELWNMYGPTETTIWSTIKKITSDSEITIGKPIANTSVYILDDQNKPVPIGVTGELCIGGEGLARGYLNLPELTSLSFIPHPFEKDKIIYKTGDLARFRSDGEIECLGRVDNQVKVRGFRIEPGEIETLLAEHEAVKQSVVTANEDEDGNSRLVAYLTIKENKIPDKANINREHISDWQLVWDDTYTSEERGTDPMFDISGWKSSYTGSQIPETEMREWVEHTVNNIRDLKPENILEIGCGTGLLLFRLAPECTRYTGLDFSSKVLNKTKEIVKAKNLTNVELLCREAHNLDNLNNDYDVIILNSVIQYFPDADYLLDVMEKAVHLLKPGGKIYIGDVRRLGLLNILSMGVELQRTKNISDAAELRKLTDKRVSEEEELLVEPEFFYLLKERIPAIKNVEIKLKRGKYLNELTKYRYDVLLHSGENLDEVRIEEVIDYTSGRLSIEDIDTILQTENRSIMVKNIPNSRLYDEVKLSSMLSDLSMSLPEALSYKDSVEQDKVDPEILIDLGIRHDWRVNLTWSTEGGQDHFDAVFLKNTVTNPVIAHTLPVKNQDIRVYVNNPLIPRFRRNLVPVLREFLTGRLPEYMIPSVFMLMDKLPLTANGKIDRKSLPAPEVSRTSEKYTAAGNEVEKQLTEIWEGLLRVKNISVNDNFFQLGGHSLLVFQLFRQIEEKMHVELSITLIFEFPTINQLAVKIAELKRN